MNEATEGKIQLTIQAGGVLGGEADTLDMAIQGDLDIATCANSVLANYIPEMSILDQAFLWYHHLIPSSRAVERIISLRSSSYIWLISGNLGPSSSRFGPTSGEGTKQDIWSFMSIKSPAP